MASPSMASTLIPSSSSSSKLHFFLFSSCSSSSSSSSSHQCSSLSPSTISLARTFEFWSIAKSHHQNQRRKPRRHSFSVKALSLDFSGSFFEEGMGDEDPPTPPAGSAISLAEDKEEPQCPPGLRQYETMAVLRPDMSEDERLSVIQRYEELIVAGGGMYVEVFNRGVIPLAYSIKKRNKAGETNTYLDGIYLLFTYFTKPESMVALETRLKTDDDVIRSCSFKIRKRKY